VFLFFFFCVLFLSYFLPMFFRKLDMLPENSVLEKLLDSVLINSKSDAVQRD
jgi:hypothetical protein